MSSLKQVVYNALMKCATPEEGVALEFDSAITARDAYIAAVMTELFPEGAQQVEVPVAKAKSPKKKSAEEKEAAKAEKAKAKAEKPAKSPKKSPEEKEKAKAEAKAEKEKAKAEAKAEKEKAKAEKPAKSPKKSPEEKEAEKAAKAEAKAKAAEDKPKKSPKKAKKVDSDANLPKIDPTWRKTLKEADKEHAKELEPELLAYVNALSNVAFHGKGAKEHVADFLATRTPPAPPAEEKVEVDLDVVEFSGKEYYVNPETKRVYEGEVGEDGALKVTRPVGYVGMADFKDMTL